jgi:hypothetical protein
MNDDPRMADIRRRILRPESVEDVRRTLPDLDVLSREPNSERWAAEEFQRAFERLRVLTAAEPDQAFEILTGDLLPRCLRSDSRDDNGNGYILCHTFGEWLADLPEEHRLRVRATVLPQAIATLSGDRARNAIRLISSIGYWNVDVLAALDQIALSREDEVGDHALSARVHLCLDPNASSRSLFLKKLHGRIPSGPNQPQMFACQVLGTPETAELVWSHWLAPEVSMESEWSIILVPFAGAILAEIAARTGDAAFTQRVWSWLVELSRRSAKGLEQVFAMNSSLINRLDIGAAVPELVRLAIRAEGHHRYLYYLRVLECERPAHMSGWDEVPISELVIVQKDAVVPTGMIGRSSTKEFLQKGAAWDVLLCRGESSVLPTFDETLADENGYVAERFLRLGACLRLDPLPAVIHELIAGDSKPAWDDSERLIAQVGAIEAARGAGTREAFSALLGYRQLGKGVLLSVVEALAETAFILLEGGDRSVVEQLLLGAENTRGKGIQAAAAAALAALLKRGALSVSEMGRAVALLKQPVADSFAVRELLFALATRPPDDVPPAAFNFAGDVLASPGCDENSDIRASAIALLSRQPGACLDPTFLANHLGLREHEDETVVSQPTLKGLSPYIIGRYFVAESARFGPAVAELLRKGDSSALARVLPSVRETGAKNPPAVLDALVDRLREADGGRVADTRLLSTLAAVAPGRLLTDGCLKVSAWLPQARADLADTLGDLGPLSDRLPEARFELLTRLAGDGLYAVRRAAYRAASKCDRDRFTKLALSWARWRGSGREGPRRYAAECAGWLPAAVEAVHMAQLGWDQEPSVREAYQRSMRERADRLLAGEFETKVLGVRESADVIRNWRHGIGLSRVGDDSTIQRLSDRLGGGLPPSVRFWLERVRNAVERRWGEITREWPEPWYARPGHLESFSGVLRDADGKETSLTGTLWSMPDESPGGRSSWGGWAITERPWMGDGQLVLEGRRPAQLLVTNAFLPSYEVLFLGNSPYPDPVRA